MDDLLTLYIWFAVFVWLPATLYFWIKYKPEQAKKVWYFISTILLTFWWNT